MPAEGEGRYPSSPAPSASCGACPGRQPSGSRRGVLGTCLRAGDPAGTLPAPRSPAALADLHSKAIPPHPASFPAHPQNLPAEALERMTSVIWRHFRKLPARRKRQGKVRAGWVHPARHIGPASGADRPLSEIPRGAGCVCVCVCIGHFSELLLKSLSELITETNCCDCPFRPFSPPHTPSFLKGEGVRCMSPAGTSCCSRVRK